MNKLTSQDIMAEVRDSVAVQSYEKRTMIEGVKVVQINKFSSEDGTFEEVMRLDDQGQLLALPELKVQQINRSKLLPQAIKAWHLHFNQEEAWYIPSEDHMMLGLWDVRENSPTKNVKMRIAMGAGLNKLVFIPRGVAHGVVNLSPEAGNIFYFTNQYFSMTEPDERRLPWDAAGAEFWVPERG